MGRHKRICIITTDIPTEGGQSNEGQSTENEINGETSEHSATDIPSEGKFPNLILIKMYDI